MKSRHKVKTITCVASNAALVYYFAGLYPRLALNASIVDHSKLLNQYVPGDLIYGR